MSYHVETTARSDKEFKKLDKYTQQMIKSWIVKNLQNCENPRAHGKGLTANKSGQWRYRIGDYRLLCLIQDEELVILALTAGHRRDIYSTQRANYAFLCFEKASTPTSETKLSIVTVYEDLEGHAEILSTEEVEFGV